MKYLISIFLLLLFLSGCSRTNQVLDSNSKIDFIKKPIEFLELSKFVSSINYVPLETNSKCNIKRISKIKFINDSIFIFNEIGWGITDILIFDKAGRFLSTFCQSGLGPEEIQSPRDLIENGQSILIWDRNKVAEFDKRGNFKKKLFNASFGGRNFFKDSCFIYLYHGTELPGVLSQFDTTGRLIMTFKPPISKKISSAFEGEALFCSNGEYHFFSPSVDTVWTLNESHLIPKYVFNFENDLTLQMLFQMHGDITPPEFQKIMNSNPFSHVFRFIESDNYLYISYSKLQKNGNKLIAKDSGHQIDFEFCINDIDNGIYGLPIAIFDDTLVMLLEPLKILKRIKSNSNPIKTEFDHLAETVSEDSNPVLMYCKLRY
jgi:hypothetical protein